ncbi:MAG: carbohydrate-binding protein [Fibrobacter sp.]|nr:carbohydrate-binding protein [Fibrobacter sp.]
MGMFEKFSGFASVACVVAGIVLFGAALTKAAPDPNFHVYIAYGQSNMGGTANAENADKVENPRFKIFATQKCSGKGRNTLGEVYPAVPSLFNCGNTISIADWFGRTMADSMPDVTVAIIPVAVGGASIKLFDQDQYKSYLSTAEGWLQNYAKEYASDGNVTKTIIDIAKKAQQVGVIKGFIFHQGETDGGYPDWAKIVKKTRDDILKALNMSSDTVPFVAGELLREGCCYSDRVSKLPNSMDNTYYASSENLKGNGVDRYHFNHDAYVEFGKRYAEQMLKAVNRKPVEPVPQKPFGKVEGDSVVAGEPAKIPGKIEAENYDINGVGSGNSSYSDKDSENKGGAYRKDGVDIEKGGDNYAVGYTEEGEWLEYTVNVSANGSFDVKAHVASGSETSGFSLLLDDKELVPAKTVPKTGEDWSVYEDVELGSVKLDAGKHVLKLLITGNFVNIDWIEFAEPSTSIRTKFAVSKTPVTYDVFDMLGSHVGRVEAASAQDVSQKVRALVKQNGAYLVKSRAGSTTIRVMK